MKMSVGMLFLSFLSGAQSGAVISSMFYRKETCETPKVFSSVQTSNILNCTLLCLASSICESFSYSENNQCLLHKVAFSDLDDCKETTRHYNKQHISCLNGGYYNYDEHMCYCKKGYVGKTCERRMEDCSEGSRYPYYANLKKFKQVMKIKPLQSPRPFKALCDLKHGLTYIQVRNNRVSFNKSWSEYKSGFKYDFNTDGDFWLGNEKIYYLTYSGYTTLTIRIGSGTHWYAAYYNGFRMGNESQNFKLTFKAYQKPKHVYKPLGDCLSQVHNIGFSTPDHDNDENPNNNCAQIHGAGWWFSTSACTLCNINGVLTQKKKAKNSDVFWLPQFGKTILRLLISVQKHRGRKHA